MLTKKYTFNTIQVDGQTKVSRVPHEDHRSGRIRREMFAEAFRDGWPVAHFAGSCCGGRTFDSVCRQTDGRSQASWPGRQREGPDRRLSPGKASGGDRFGLVAVAAWRTFIRRAELLPKTRRAGGRRRVRPSGRLFAAGPLADARKLDA